MIKLKIILILLFTSFLSFGSKKESLNFDLKFGIIKGGAANMIITDTIYKGIPAVSYYLEGNTTGLTDKLFKVHDIYQTIVDAKTGLPLKSIRNIKEKKYRYYNEVFYFHENDSIYSNRSGGREVPKDLVDIISVFFYFTKNNIQELEHPEDITVLPTFHADEINDIKIRYQGIETIETEIGKVECHVLSPVIKKGKLLKRSDGVKVFIAKDTKIPVLLEFDMGIGALRAILKNYNPGTATSQL